MRKWKGYPYPLGATWMGNGVNFALYSQHATAVELCLFDRSNPATESVRLTMTERDDEVWHIFLPDVSPGQHYGFRVHGPWAPDKGARFNPFKVLLDPYARAISGEFTYPPSMYGFIPGQQEADLQINPEDNAACVPKSVVVDPAFDWADDRRPRRSLEESVIYEMHVRGFTQLCPGIPREIRGTYRALAHPAAIEYLKGLGVTAVELLPIQEIADEPFLRSKGLTNYWGYNTIGYFAPASRYAQGRNPGDAVREFKEMVKALHAAGLEVILDVVYNHTGEGNHLGPTLGFRGIDNRAYYRLVGDQPRFYMDYTGTGNTLNVPNPRVLQMIMDSLRYWVQEMHVDGFRFDLAPTLARETHAVSKLSTFFSVIHQDPVVSQVKLIAEPWDIGEGGYHVGNFPVLWCEWNGRYRDIVRRFWKGDELPVCEMAYRLMGSPDLYESSSKHPTASINFVTCHDGFTLADLVSYNQKHNEGNLEKNLDGNPNNLSWNCGIEGPTEAPLIQQLRRRQRRNFVLTLFLSQGVPMLTAGDEFGRTQLGNNNAYCQNNQLSWLKWDRSPEEQAFQDFVARVIRFRAEHPVFHRPKFFQAREVIGDELRDMTWFRPDGTTLNVHDWMDRTSQRIGLLLVGSEMRVENFEGEQVVDETFYLAFNPKIEDAAFVLPGGPSVAWQLEVDSYQEQSFLARGLRYRPGSPVLVSGNSLHVYRQISHVDPGTKLGI